jgi:hypothetical protein
MKTEEITDIQDSHEEPESEEKKDRFSPYKDHQNQAQDYQIPHDSDEEDSEYIESASQLQTAKKSQQIDLDEDALTT